MEDIFAAIVWIGVIVSGIIKFINKNSSDEKGKQNASEIEKKIKGFFEGNIEQSSTQEKQVDRTQNSKSDSKSEDKWIPVYEEKPEELMKKNNQTGEGIINPAPKELEYKTKEESDGKNVSTAESISNNNKRRSRDIMSEQKVKNHSNRKKTSNSPLDGNFTDLDLLKGVIFKEILDDPRARNPYRPIIKK